MHDTSKLKKQEMNNAVAEVGTNTLNSKLLMWHTHMLRERREYKLLKS